MLNAKLFCILGIDTLGINILIICTTNVLVM